jgi:nucleotide-binding universal stress UspA family protein
MKILLATDGSPCSDAAVHEVARWQWLPQSEVRIITVEAPLEPSRASGSEREFMAYVNQEQGQLAKYLLDATTYLAQNAPNLRVTSSLLKGFPQDAIVAEAERFGADVVVVGSNGYGPIQRFFLGSVSLDVAQHAPCSVLIVRPPGEVSSEKNSSDSS